MKNKRTAALITIPADLRLEEFAAYFSALAEWARPNPENLEVLFNDFRANVKSDDSVQARMKFSSYLFFECKAGIDFLATLKRKRLEQTVPVGSN